MEFHPIRCLLPLLASLCLAAAALPPSPAPGGDGFAVEYYPDQSPFARGKVARDTSGLERMEGEWTFWYPDGKVRAVGSFREGRREGARGESGVPTAGREGVWTFWYETGQKRQEIEYLDGRENGKFFSWFPDGQMEAQGRYVRGLKRGRWTLWHENGRRRFTGDFTDGREEGPVVFWHDNGQKMLQGVFRLGKREGRFVTWQADGTRASEGAYRADTKDGSWNYWDAQGRLAKTEIYDRGELIRVKNSDQLPVISDQTKTMSSQQTRSGSGLESELSEQTGNSAQRTSSPSSPPDGESGP